jgi:hypothetical protein
MECDDPPLPEIRIYRDEQRHAWCFHGGAKHGTETPFKDHADFVTVALFLKEQAGGRVRVRPAP